MRPNIFVDTKFEARPSFETIPKFGARPILRPKVSQANGANGARPSQVLEYPHAFE